MDAKVKSIAQDAQRISLLFQYGALDASSVVTWADNAIVALDSPPDALVDLSLAAPASTAEILSCLHRLSLGADFWSALRSAVPALRNFIAQDPERAERIAGHLLVTVYSFDVKDVPKDFHFIYRFDDAFSLAREDIYGDLKAVCREFADQMDGLTV
jgi:hypothetical protein